MSIRPDRRQQPVNKIFGEPLPDASTDEREPGSPEADARHDDWLRDNRPPHHS